MKNSGRHTLSKAASSVTLSGRAAFEPTTQWVLSFCLMMPEDVKRAVNANVLLYVVFTESTNQSTSRVMTDPREHHI